MTLFEEATRRPKDDDDDTGGTRRPSPTDNIVAHVVEMVNTTTEPVTREMVERQLGRPVSRHVWLKVDGQLLLQDFMHGVSIISGLNNKTLYVKTTTPAVPPAP